MWLGKRPPAILFVMWPGTVSVPSGVETPGGRWKRKRETSRGVHAMTERKVNRRSLVQGAASAALFGAPFMFAQSPASADERQGGDDANARARGKRIGLGRPWWPPYNKLEVLLKLWAGEHTGIMELEQLGRSVEGRPVYAVSLTDPRADGDQKEHVLVTSPTRRFWSDPGSTAVMAIIEWLLSGDATAKEILRRQVVVCLSRCRIRTGTRKGKSVRSTEAGMWMGLSERRRYPRERTSSR